MKKSLLFSMIVIAIGCSATKNASMKVLGKSSMLNGVWVPVRQEIGGKELPEAAFKNQKLVLSDSTYTFSAESVDKGIVKYGKSTMDIYGREGVNAGKHFTAAYKYENDELMICYNLLGDGYPDKFETAGKMSLFLAVFKKEQAK